MKGAHFVFRDACLQVPTHLDVAVVALGRKGHVDWEEVVGLPGHAELQASCLVVGVDDR